MSSPRRETPLKREERLLYRDHPEYVNAGPNEKIGPEGRTALHEAARAGYEHLVERLIEEGADVDLEDGEGNTAIQYAVWREHPEVVRVLVEKDANTYVGVTNFYDVLSGTTPLHYAVRRNLIEIIRILLETVHSGDSLDSWKDESGNTPVHTAAAEHKVDALRLLLEKEPDLSQENDNGYTALSLAINHLARANETIDLLLDAGADPDSIDGSGSTPLMLAVQEGDIDIARHLLERGANPDIENNRDYTALDLAEEDDMIELLEEYDAHHGTAALDAMEEFEGEYEDAEGEEGDEGDEGGFVFSDSEDDSEADSEAEDDNENIGDILRRMSDHDKIQFIQESLDFCRSGRGTKNDLFLILSILKVRYSKNKTKTELCASLQRVLDQYRQKVQNQTVACLQEDDLLGEPFNETPVSDIYQYGPLTTEGRRQCLSRNDLESLLSTGRVLKDPHTNVLLSNYKTNFGYPVVIDYLRRTSRF